jgi:colanic acid biosynthesis glycosyl transferase WcaI
MRFLIVTQYYPPEVGAPQIRLSAVTRALRAHGHDVEVVTALPNHPTGRILEGYRGRLVVKETLDEVPVRRIWMYAALGSGPRRLLSYVSFAALVPFALARAGDADVVFVESPPPLVVPAAAFAAKRRRALLVLNIADLWPDVAVDIGALEEGRAVAAMRGFVRWCYRRADVITTVTDGLAAEISRTPGVPSAKVVLLPNGIDPQRFAPGPADPDVAVELSPGGGELFLYAGTVGFAHGAEVAIRAIQRVREQHPNAHLVFMGGGSDRQRLERIVADEAISGVRFIDPRPPEAVADAMRVATAGIATLRAGATAESTRLAKMFPPMACARPLIISGTGEGAALAHDAGAALVTPPGDDATMARAMCDVIESPTLARRLGDAGRRLVERRFSWDAIVGEWLGEIEDRVPRSRR